MAFTRHGCGGAGRDCCAFHRQAQIWQRSGMARRDAHQTVGPGAPQVDPQLFERGFRCEWPARPDSWDSPQPLGASPIGRSRRERHAELTSRSIELNATATPTPSFSSIAGRTLVIAPRPIVDGS
jgi:hypothetical protein